MTVHARGSVILAILVLAALGLMARTGLAQQRVGVNSAVNPEASGTPPGATTRQLMIGQQVVYREHIVTSGLGQTQILFLDESTMTIAPDSDLTIDEFVYNPDTGKGQLAMSAVRGVMRFVGGKLSKNENAVTMTTPAGTLGIRGGVFMMDLGADGRLDVVFLYGKGLTITGASGVPQTITRPGFAVTIAGRGAAPSAPAPAPPGVLTKFLAALAGRAGSTAGAANPPTDAAVANSGIGSTISGNVAASIQAANQNQPPSGQPQPVNVASIQSNQQVNTVQSQPQINSTTSGVVVYPFGFWLEVHNDGNLSLIPGLSSTFATLSNGQLILPSQGAPFPHNGGSIPLAPGLANFGPANARDSNGNPIVGQSFFVPDQSLFIAYGNNPGAGLDSPGGKTTFVLGGMPTVNLPTTGVGTYSGSAFGGVYNNGASYVATGAFSASYNFGSLSGSMTISNFDGKTFGGPISGVPGAFGQYLATLSGSGLDGVAEGLFFGRSASATGGLFAAASSLNPNSYHVFGVFAGGRQ
jgi:hypothetical protein